MQFETVPMPTLNNATHQVSFSSLGTNEKSENSIEICLYQSHICGDNHLACGRRLIYCAWAWITTGPKKDITKWRTLFSPFYTAHVSPFTHLLAMRSAFVRHHRFWLFFGKSNIRKKYTSHADNNIHNYGGFYLLAAHDVIRRLKLLVDLHNARIASFRIISLDCALPKWCECLAKKTSR